MDVSALHGLSETRHAPRGKTRLLGDAAPALPALGTKTLEHLSPFLPNPMSVGSLKDVCTLADIPFSAYLTDTQLSRFTRIPVPPPLVGARGGDGRVATV